MPAQPHLPDGPVLIAVAHPDDEVMIAGGLMPALATIGLHVLIATDGAAGHAAHGFADGAVYAAMQQAETLAACALGGVEADQIRLLRLPDQDAVRHVRRIARAVTRLRPRTIITHVYEGGHPDHVPARRRDAFGPAAVAEFLSLGAPLALPTQHHAGGSSFTP